MTTITLPPLTGLVQGLLCEIGKLVEEILISLAIAVADLFGFTAVSAQLATALATVSTISCFA